MENTASQHDANDANTNYSQLSYIRKFGTTKIPDWLLKGLDTNETIFPLLARADSRRNGSEWEDTKLQAPLSAHSQVGCDCKLCGVMIMTAGESLC